MKKPIAIVFSDLHINNWSRFNEDKKRTLEQFRVLSILGKKSKKYNVPILFCGDFFHKPETMDQELAEICYNEINKLDLRIRAISGNHDMKKVSKIGEKPFSWLYTLPSNFIDIMDYKQDTLSSYNQDIILHGVPYIDHNIGLCEYLKNPKLDKSKKHILMLHTDYPGAKDTDNREIDSVENLNINILDRFDLIICGHIHKPQRLSKKVYMIGAPNQQRRTDMNCKLGYWLIMEDLTMKFVELSDFPKFIDVESEEDVKDDGNYYTLITRETIVESDNKIHKGLSKKRLVRLYLKYNNIKDKEKKECLLDIIKKAEEDD